MKEFIDLMFEIVIYFIVSSSLIFTLYYFMIERPMIKASDRRIRALIMEGEIVGIELRNEMKRIQEAIENESKKTKEN